MSLSYKVHPWAFGPGAAAHRGLRARGRPPEELSRPGPTPKAGKSLPRSPGRADSGIASSGPPRRAGGRAARNPGGAPGCDGEGRPDPGPSLSPPRGRPAAHALLQQRPGGDRPGRYPNARRPPRPSAMAALR